MNIKEAVYTSASPNKKPTSVLQSISLVILSALLITPAWAEDSVWTAFWDKEHYKRGFKNASGEVMIPPTFMGFTIANSFRNIIAVMEEQGDQYPSYYLLKDGRKIGHNNTYIFDMSFDCESEYSIRFRDRKTDKVGFFDGAGNIMIPALYSDAQPFTNGVAVVLKGATRQCDHPESASDHNSCEHWFWKGGTTQLINRQHEVLIDNFAYDFDLDLYSLVVSDQNINNAVTSTFKGNDGKSYSFDNRKAAFKQWFVDELLPALNKETLSAFSFDKVAFWHNEDGWKKQDKQVFIDNNLQAILHELSQLKDNTRDYFVSGDSLNQFIFTDDIYRKYYDDCGYDITNKYPVLTLVTQYTVGDDSKQNHYGFLKTDDGYRLISISMRDAVLK